MVPIQILRSHSDQQTYNFHNFPRLGKCHRPENTYSLFPTPPLENLNEPTHLFAKVPEFHLYYEAKSNHDFHENREAAAAEEEEWRWGSGARRGGSGARRGDRFADSRK